MAELTGSTLTVQEIEAAHLAAFDLGPGYPQLYPAPYIRRLYREGRLHELSLQFAPDWTVGRQTRLDDDLERAVRVFLDVSETASQAAGIRATFTGSVALDRVLSACERLARSQGLTKMSVVTTTPSIDIMRLFLEERAAILPSFVQSRSGGQLGLFDSSMIVAEMQRVSVRSDSLPIVLLTSPENPTGAYWSAEDLTAIGSACTRIGAVLIVDHCFLLAGVHDFKIPRIWDLGLACKWFSVWDTGKTFGLNEDKIGFVFAGGDDELNALDEALAVLQFGIARRQKLLFTSLLDLAVRRNHAGWLRSACRANLQFLAEFSALRRYDINPVNAGSLALLDISPTRRSDEEVRKYLLSVGVGVIAGNVFFHDSKWRPRNLIRIALARDPAHFRAAASAMFDGLAAVAVH